MLGILLSILVAILWGVWAFSVERAQNISGPFGTMALTAIIGTVLTTISAPSFLWLAKQTREKDFLNGWKWAIIAVVTLTLAGICFAYALKIGKPSLVIIISSTYPLVSMFLYTAVLKENIGLTQWFGAGLIVFGVALLALKEIH